MEYSRVKDGNIPKRLFFLIMGALILGAGNAVCINSGLGADPINVFYTGLSQYANITMGSASSITALFMIFLTLFLEPQQLGIGTIASPFFVTIGMDYLVPQFQVPVFPFNYIIMFAGLILIALGSAFSISANIGKNSYDAFILSVSRKKSFTYCNVRRVTDICLLIAGVMLGGKLTPATVIAIVAIGKMITVFVSKLENMRMKEGD